MDCVTDHAAASPRIARRNFVLSGLAGAALLHTRAHAVELLTFVSPFEAGSAPDLYTRIVAPEIGKLLGRTAVVENKPGAAGNIAAEYVARRPGDGSMIMVGTAALCEINPLVFANLHWSMKDFTPLVKGVQSPLVLVTNPKLPVKTLDQLVSYVKAHPGTLNYASYNAGTPSDFLGAQLNQVFGLDLVAVPYRGSASQVSALLADNSPLGFAQTQNSLQHIKNGGLNAIAITSDERFRLLPDVPTFRELGHPELSAMVWFGLLAQASTPKDILAKFVDAAVKAQQEPSVRNPLLAEGYDLPNESGEPFAKSIEAGREHWAALVKLTGFKASR
ncbi:MAG TPA: tripartite tricarboxylate transporter substrate binding protein [Xanthobacteraceae bacterium]|nr:tripartite tricarboxylate transporter substrate binding protein [Xanthobacteraceae bacterium]